MQKPTREQSVATLAPQALEPGTKQSKEAPPAHPITPAPVQEHVLADLKTESSLRAVNRDSRFDPVSCLLTAIMLADLGLVVAFLLFASPFSLLGQRLSFEIFPGILAWAAFAMPVITFEQVRDVLAVGVILIAGGWLVTRVQPVKRKSRRRVRHSPGNSGG